MLKITKIINTVLIIIAAVIIILLFIVSNGLAFLASSLVPIIPSIYVLYIPGAMFVVFGIAALFSIFTIFFQDVRIEVKAFYSLALVLLSFILFVVAFCLTVFVVSTMFVWFGSLAYVTAIDIYSLVLLGLLFIMAIFPRLAQKRKVDSDKNRFKSVRQQPTNNKDSNQKTNHVKNGIPKPLVSPFTMELTSNQDTKVISAHIKDEIPKPLVSPFES